MTAPGKENKKAIEASDILYWSGAVLVVVGLLFDGPDGLCHALIAAGAFCLFIPLLELSACFVKGLKS